MLETIAVTGATGQVGRELVRYLQQNNIDNRLLVRDLKKASLLAHPSSRLVSFDYRKSETYAPALKSANRLFLVCDILLVAEAESLLNSAKEAGIKQIVMMSGIGADKSKIHALARLEKIVEASGIPYIALRANWFFQNFGSFFREMVTDKRELSFPDAKTPISFVDSRDIAEVAFYFLTHPIPQSTAYDITGPESLTHQDVADLFSKHLPYKVTYKQLSEKEAKEELGWDDEWLHLFKDIRDGFASQVSNSVQKILERTPRRFETYILENRSLWIS